MESSIETSMDSGLEQSRVAASASTISLLDDVIEEARRDLESRQQADGHWVFELEADATIPSEYILLEHFLDEIDIEIERKLAVYLRGIQGRHGGRSEEQTSELQSLMRISYAVFCLTKKINSIHIL